MAGVNLHGIGKSFTGPSGRGITVLDAIDLEVKPGECFSLLGPSGCGKTTLLRIISGLERPDTGSIVMDGRDVSDWPPEKRPTAMVFQNYALFPHLSVEGNVAFGLSLKKKSKRAIASKVEEVLRLVQLEGMNRRRINELSGGQQQRVALARVLAVEPKILLMDEPLSNLDAALRRTTRSAIRRIQTELGLTLIYVTHDQEEGLMISDRMALMREGKILQTGSPRELFECPASAEVARFLGQRNMIPAVVRGQSDEGLVLGLEGDENGMTLRVTGREIGSSRVKGEKVWLALQPADIELSADAKSASDGWPGRVTLTAFAGSNIEVEVQLNGLKQILRIHLPLTGPATMNSGAGFGRGDRVTVRVNTGGGRIFARGNEGGPPCNPK